MNDILKDIELTNDGIIYKKHMQNGTFQEWIIPKELIEQVYEKYIGKDN